jgi:exodeoxyribonuclease III
MRILAWNCAMALHKKARTFAALKPDIAVISECGRGSVPALEALGYAGVWVGANPHKGLGVFVRKPLRPRLLGRARQKWVAALDIEGHSQPLRLIGVWACRVGVKNCDNYIGQLYKALTRNPQWLDCPNTIVAGDFNSNSIWDANRAAGNHTDVVKLLAARGIVSAYHAFYGEEQGRESRHTLYLLKNRKRPFHIDYVFIPSAWRLEKLSIRDGAKWAALSDHRPLVVDVTRCWAGSADVRTAAAAPRSLP